MLFTVVFLLSIHTNEQIPKSELSTPRYIPHLKLHKMSSESDNTFSPDSHYYGYRPNAEGSQAATKNSNNEWTHVPTNTKSGKESVAATDGSGNENDGVQKAKSVSSSVAGVCGSDGGDADVAKAESSGKPKIKARLVSPEDPTTTTSTGEKYLSGTLRPKSERNPDK